MTSHNTPDLSSFYQHALDYSQYVSLAYGLSSLVLGILVMAILAKYRRLKRELAYYEERS